MHSTPALLNGLIFVYQLINFTDDQWLAAFLRGCKFSLERAKEKLDFHYTVRNTAKDLFRITHKDTLFYEILDLG